MMERFFTGKQSVIATLLAVVLFSCNHYISTFDQLAYTQATSLKVDVMNLIDESTEPYSSHTKEVDEVVSNLRKAIEYERHRPKNDITLKMWNKMLDSTAQKGIIGSYLASWKKSGNKSQTLVDEYKPLAGEGFDLIADLESHKIKDKDASITSFINK